MFMDQTPEFNLAKHPHKPQPDEILAEMEAIAKSRKITPQPLKILRYIVTETLAGRAEQLSENMIGESALELDIVRMTSVVRAHVFKLRQQLDYYYATGEKGQVRVIIDIPKRSYRPEFSYPDTARDFGYAEAAALLSAQTAMDQLTLPALNDALKTLDEILKVHPDHPLVLAMKADVHTFRAIHGLRPRPELEMALQLARRAVAVDPKLWQPLYTYGYVQSVFRNWGEASAAFEKANSIPRAADIPAHPSYVAYLPSQGQTDEAVRLVQQIVDSAKGYYGNLAPTRPVVRCDLGWFQLLAGQVNSSIRTLDAAIKDSDFYLLYIFRAIAQEALGDPKGALQILRKTPLKWHESAVIWGMKALFLGLSGSKRRARFELWKLQMAKSILRAYVPPGQFMVAYIGLGEHQKAIHYMREGVLECDPLFLLLGSLPHLRHLADLPSFHAVLKEAGLVWNWRRKD
jgi:tetratricopeptide (TPR) repeat protein